MLMLGEILETEENCLSIGWKTNWEKTFLLYYWKRKKEIEKT